jgi:inhibitor of KinA
MISVIQYGEYAVVLKAGCAKTADCVAMISRWRRRLAGKPRPGLLSVQPALDCLLLEYQEPLDLNGLLLELQEPYLEEEPHEEQVLRIPVCYNPPFGRDLERIAAETGLTVDQVIQVHSSTGYSVWMIGFMPGFAYMGELPERLQLERKLRPDPLIPAGSVAIAEEYTAIYPFDSPGGWHVIGRTNLRVVDYSRKKPWLLDYNMRVQFVPVTASELESSVDEKAGH